MYETYCKVEMIWQDLRDDIQYLLKKTKRRGMGLPRRSDEKK
jgi:hypothetical protein